MLSVMKCLRPTHCGGTGKRISRSRLVARMVSSRRRICGRVMELDNGHGSFLALSNRGALSILDASFNLARASYLVSGDPWSTVHMDQKEHLEQSYVFSAVLGAFAGLTSALVRMHRKRGFAFATREGCRELASEVGRVSVTTRFKRSSRSIRARSRALRSIAPDVVLECSGSDEDVMSFARRERRADFLEASLQLLDPFDMDTGGVRWFLPRGKHDS